MRTTVVPGKSRELGIFRDGRPTPKLRLRLMANEWQVIGRGTADRRQMFGNCVTTLAVTALILIVLCP